MRCPCAEAVSGLLQQRGWGAGDAELEQGQSAFSKEENFPCTRKCLQVRQAHVLHKCQIIQLKGGNFWRHQCGHWGVGRQQTWNVSTAPALGRLFNLFPPSSSAACGCSASGAPSKSECSAVGGQERCTRFSSPAPPTWQWNRHVLHVKERHSNGSCPHCCRGRTPRTQPVIIQSLPSKDLILVLRLSYN